MAASRMEGRLWLLQERLKQERLFVTKEKECVRLLNAELQSTCEKLFHVSWIAGQQWRNFQRLQAHPAKASYANKLLDSAEFVDAYKSLGYLESKYGDFLKKLRESPQLIASSLAFVDQMKVNLDTKQVARLLLNSLYGNCLLPEDENYVLILMRSLMEFQIIKCEQPRKFFGSPRNWSFTVIFDVLIESLFSAKLYLTAALHTPILHVLARDSKIQAQLPYICTRFVQSLQEKLYCFPPSLRWLICQLYNVLRSSSYLSVNEVKCMVSELLFNYLVCPAIINPEPYGINSDMQVSKIARINLQQISSLLCKRCTSPWEGSGGYSDDLFNTVDMKCISSFVDSILDGAGHVSNFPEQQTLPGLCRTSVLITENELKSLICFLRMIHSWEGDIQFPHLQQLEELLELLPPENLSAKGLSTPATAPSPLASPKVNHKKKVFSKSRSKSRLGDDDLKIGRSPMAALATITPQVPKAQRYQQECFKRLGELYEENKPVLVVPLGYSVVESPGMLPEEKVLGVERKSKQGSEKPPERSLSDSDTSMRQRSNSTRFTKLFHNLSIEKDLNNKDSVNRALGSSTSHNQLETIIGSPPQFASTDPSRQPSTAGIRKVDILSHNPFENNRPDVVDILSKPVKPPDDQVDLLSFDNDLPAVPALVPVPYQPSSTSLIDAPLLDCNSPPSSTRDSTISSGSSERTSSTLSSLSSGTRESAIDSGFNDLEEQFNSTEERNPFRKNASALSHNRNSAVVSDAPSQNIVNEQSNFTQNRYSSGSSTIISDQTSNRESKLSFDESTKTGSSSSSDEISDQDAQDRPTRTKSNSLKRAGNKMKSKTLRFKDKIKMRKGIDRPKSMPETDLRSHAEKSGLFRRNKRTRQKQSGPRTYQEIDETLDYFASTPDIPKEQVEAAGDRTPKDIDNTIILKYSQMAAIQASEKSQEDNEQILSDEEDEEDIDEETRFDDTKRKLRLVLNQADFHNLPWLVSKDRIIKISPLRKSVVGELMTFLHVQLAEAINLQNRSLAAQLHETIRSVKQLSLDSCSKILDSIESDYQARMPYLAYLTRSRQTLLTTQSHLERLIERVQKNQMLCQKCFNTSCITLFLEVHDGRINSFITDFRSSEKCPTVDEKCKLLEEFLNELSGNLSKDDTWLGATEEQLQQGNIAIERDIMARVYNDAFYPNGQIDMERDKAFTEHVKSLQKVVGITHKAIRIPKLYRKEAPWPSAQQELSTINAYKTPKDKLKCVQRCCFTIMNLLNMACTTNGCEPAGADEFVPALVFVLIHSNPPSLLSTMQYVNNFYEMGISGEEGWSWMQLRAAIEYTKTIRVKIA